MAEKVKETVKTGSSIVYRLNARLFFRMFGIFLALDIFICVIAFIGVVSYSEHTASKAAALLSETGFSEQSNEWTELSGLRVVKLKAEPKGFFLPKPFSFILPDNTAHGRRSIVLAGAYSPSFLLKMDALTYKIELPIGNEDYSISIALRSFSVIFRRTFLILIIIELLYLFKGLFSVSRIIRRTLRPISELAETAQTLNRGVGAFTPREMEALAGKLEGINAARLDTRIPLDETQDELKNLAKAINGMLDRINESYRSQVRFVSDASHELRTPISVIQGYVNLLDRWGKNDEKTLQESIDAIKDEAANMKELIEQLLFLARGDNNTIILQLEQFKLTELISEVLKETKMIDSAHEYEARLEVVEVIADRALIKQALRILIDNAIKYTNAGGRIVISSEIIEGKAKLTVQDDGIGIPPEAVPKIFDRFYRAEESRARATGGAGLGLSIALWIAERHRGHLEVMSREGIGTRISIVMPAAKTAGNELAESIPVNGK